MIQKLSLLLLCTIFATECAASDVTSVVEVLQDDTFDTVTKDGFWLVEFYAPWCGHCKALNPILDEISEKVLAQGMHIGKVDTTVHKKVTKRFEISGYPTLKFRLTSNDEWQTYSGGRKSKDLVAFAERMTGEPLPTLTSVGDLDTLVARSAASGDGTGVAFVFGGGGGRDSWLKLAGRAARNVQHRSYCGAVAPGVTLPWSGVGVSGKAEFAGLPGDGKPFVAAVEKGELPRFYPGELPSAEGGESESRTKIDTTSLDDWMKANDASLFTKFGAMNFRKLGKLGKRLVIAITDPDNSTTPAYLAGVQQVARALSSERASQDPQAAAKASAVLGEEAAKEAEEKLKAAKARGASWEVLGDIADAFLFGHLDGVKWKDFVEQFNVYGDLPRLVVMDMPKEIFYEDPSVDEADEIETFLREVHANKVPAQREGYQGSVKRFLAKVNDMGWRFYAMILPLVLSLVAFCFTKPADDPYAYSDRKAE